MKAQSPAGPAAVGDFLDMLAAERGASQNTLDAYRRDLRDYVGALAARKLTPLTASTQEIRDYLGDGEAVRRLDLMIGIDEGQAEPLRQPPPHGGLARAHHSDEHKGPPGQPPHQRLRARVARGGRRGRFRRLNDGLIRHDPTLLSRRRAEIKLAFAGDSA